MKEILEDNLPHKKRKKVQYLSYATDDYKGFASLSIDFTSVGHARIDFLTAQMARGKKGMPKILKKSCLALQVRSSKTSPDSALASFTCVFPYQ